MAIGTSSLMQVICGLTSLELTELSQSCDELRLELQRHSQLVEWLVSRWNFHEMADLQEEMKQKLGEVEEQSLKSLEEAVQQAPSAFNRFSHSPDNKTFDFLQHFIRAGSCLVKPCLEYFADIHASQRSEWCPEAMNQLDFESFGEVLCRCYESLGILASGGHAESVVPKAFFSLVSHELSQLSEVKMQKEVNLLLRYFGSNHDEQSSSEKNILLDAFRMHRTAQSVPALQRALQVMRQEQVLKSRCFGEILSLAEEVLKSRIS